MTGTTESYKHRGIMPRTLSYIFRELASKPQVAATVRISYLEIYNETLVDLLADQDSEQALAIVDGENSMYPWKSLPMPADQWCKVENEHSSDRIESLLRAVASDSTNVRGLGVHVANNEEEALNLLFLGETNRAISNHQLNRASSR
jgi:kinesin family protein 6/9